MRQTQHGNVSTVFLSIANSMSSSQQLETSDIEPLLTLEHSQQPIVLLVEDCLEDRETIKRYLLGARQERYKIFEASDVEEGLELYQQCQPDVVLLDYRLPDSDGLEFLEQIQQDGSQNHPPVVLLTGQDNSRVAVAAMKAGVCDYLVKGQLAPGQLRTVVNCAIENARLRAQLQQERADRDRQIEQEKLIAQIANQIHSRLRIDEILDITVSQVRQFLKCDRVFIYRFEPDWMRAVIAESIGDGWLSMMNAQVKDASLREMCVEYARLRRIKVIADIDNADLTERHVELLKRLQIRARLAVPIWQENSLWGLLVADRCSGSRSWLSQEIELLEQLTTQVGIAIAQARLYERLQIELADRLYAEKALSQSQETIRRQLSEIESIYQTAPIGLCFIDTDLRFVRINEQLAQINGLPVSEHIGHTLREILPEMADSLEPLYRQVIESGEPILNLEVSGTNRAQPGIERDWLVSYHPQKDESDRVLGVNVMVQEITERKKTEIALRDSERRYASLANLSPVGIWRSDLDGNVIYVNDRCCEIIGLSLLESLGTNWAMALHPDDRDRVLQLWRQALEDHLPCHSEHRFIHADGSIRWVIASASAETDEENRVIGYIGTITDISDRKIAEEALRQANDNLQTLIDASPLPIVEIALDTTVLLWNPAAEKLFGWKAQEVLGKPLSIVPDEKIEECCMLRQAVARGETFFGVETYRCRSNGEIVDVLISAAPLTSENGTVTSMMLIFNDVTERKQAELQLQQQAQELRQLNEALEQTTCELSERNQELDRFTYTVSHDLKAPLRAIANLSQWIAEDLEGQLEEENQHQLELLHSRVHRMEALIDGLLGYSRIGRTEVATETVDVGQLLSEVLDSLAPPPSFTIVIQPPMPTVVVKRLLLNQVFSNLISNAIKHNNRPDGRLEISTTQKGQYYEFSVADNGPGIAPEYHERVFGIFETLKGRDVQESTGIGLSIVKKIVETEGGEITLESELGSGATFRFTWPLK
jgi:PAS domain S-box-containing protein